MRFALPPGSALQAGAGGLASVVTWARLLRARPAALGRVERGEVWLLSSAAISQLGDPRGVARLIHDMAGAGVVAFISSEALHPDALVEAERLQTPVLRLPADASLVEAEKAIVSFLVDRDRAISQRVQEVYERLLATLVEDSGMELLASIVHEVTGKSVYLLDEHFQPTVQTGGDERTAQALAELRRRYWEGQLGNVTERLMTVHAGPGGLAALIRPLTLRGAVEGYLAALGPGDDFSDFDHQVADRATSVLAIELAKQSAVVEARLRVQGDFLEELLDTPTPLTEQIGERARRLGYDLRRPHAVFVLRPRQLDNRPPPPRQYQRFVDIARRRLLVAEVATLLRERDGGVQVLLPCPAELDPHDHDEVASWVERTRSELELGLAPETLPLVAGIGRSPNGSLTHNAALREAMRAAEIAASMPAGATTLHFARLGALRLIFHLAGHPELEAFQRDVLGPLESYDRTRRAELVQTLDAFLRAGGNHTRAARDLHVHRNTLIYRLERIRELLGQADLEDPEVRLNLQLALKIRGALGAAA